MNNQILNFASHWFDVENSNISTTIYSNFNIHSAEYHESIRKRFRAYCRIKLSISSLQELLAFFKEIADKKLLPQSAFIDIVELEYVLSEFFQFYVLGFSEEDINKNKYKWSFKNYLKFGDGFYDKNYKGTILKYNECYKK